MKLRLCREPLARRLAGFTSGFRLGTPALGGAWLLGRVSPFILGNYDYPNWSNRSSGPIVNRYIGGWRVMASGHGGKQINGWTGEDHERLTPASS